MAKTQQKKVISTVEIGQNEKITYLANCSLGFNLITKNFLWILRSIITENVNILLFFEV